MRQRGQGETRIGREEYQHSRSHTSGLSTVSDAKNQNVPVLFVQDMIGKGANSEARPARHGASCIETTIRRSRNKHYGSRKDSRPLFCFPSLCARFAMAVGRVAFELS